MESNKERDRLAMADNILDWAEINEKCCDTQSANSLSIYLIEKGYGNIERGVKGFAEKLKAKINELPKDILTCSLRHQTPELVDELIKELYGG